jgi:CO dehydrogenase/acetyl-CoA synthase delta subunit
VIAESNLEHVLASGKFAVTGELGPPKNGNFEVVRKKAKILKGHVDAVNITDCQTAIVRMSSLTAGLIALSEGIEPVMQMTCRDRNRIAMQAEILGASALGIKNLLCLTGDHQKFGNHPQSKGVFDMDSIQMLTMMKAMRDEKKFQCGEEIKTHEPRLFLGAAANPFADPFEYRPIRLAKKAEAGANFIQTQIIYNVEKFEKFMEMARDLGVHEKLYILAGVTPPKSLGMAKYMKNFVPGLDVTDEVIDRLKDAKDKREEGINICVDIINRVKEIPGVAGVHVMAIEWEEAVPEIVSRAGLSPRPEYKNVEPALLSRAEVEELSQQARKEAGMSKDVEKAKEEAHAVRELFSKEKEKASRLERQLEEAEEMARVKADEMKKMSEEIENIKSALGGLKPAGKGAIPARAAALSKAALTGREQTALDSINLGLESLKKGLGLTDDQFEAIRHFLEAQYVLYGEMAAPSAPSVPTEPVGEEKAEEAAVEDKEAEEKRKQVVRLVAKGNLLLHKKDAKEALKAFEEASAILPDDEKTREGIDKAKSMLEAAPAKEEKPPVAGVPEGLTQEEWNFKLVVRNVAKGNVCLHNGDKEGAIQAFNEALKINPDNELAKKGLLEAEGAKPAEPAAPAPTPEKEEEKKVEEVKAEPEVKEAPKPAATPAPPAEISKEGFSKETVSLSDRAGGIGEDLYLEPCTSDIKPVTIGDGEKAVTVGGEKTLPFHVFEGEMPNPPVIAFDVLDIPPEDWPDALTNYYSDVMDDPVAWAKKCVADFGAKAVCLSLISTDPNGMNRSSQDAAQTAHKVIEAVDVPVVLWGCGNAEKDTETLREVTSLTGNKKVCIGPLTDANYRTLGATAMAFQLPVVAATPIDVNLAKQLNILLENLGLPLENILMDPSIGAVGYGLEYSYSVMERIRLAALTQQDDKLQVPFICNLGREVWKAKECRLPSDDIIGDQERRGIMLEAVTASSLLLAGGELMVMRHPKAIALTEALIQGMM